MTLGKELKKLRKKNKLAIDEVALYCGVNSDDIKAWEKGKRVPSDDMLRKLADKYNVNESNLLFMSRQHFYDEYRTKKDSSFCEPWGNVFHFEYTSKTLIRGIPLVHINIGAGKFCAKGIIAIGTMAKGLVSIGLLSIGLLSFGVVSLGLIGIGLLALGIMAIGLASVGVVTCGVLAVGIMSAGVLAVGLKSQSAVIVSGLLIPKSVMKSKIHRR